MVHENLKQHVPAGYCYRVRTEDCDVEDQVKEVLQYFNTAVSKEDIFSRCQMCNGDEFAKVLPAKMEQLFQAWEIRSRGAAPDKGLEPVLHWDDEAGGFSDDDDYDTFSDEGTAAPVSRQGPLLRLSKGEVDVAQGLTSKGAIVQLNSIPRNVASKYPAFHICDTCGKVYWEGTHYERFVNIFTRDGYVLASP
uniref:Mut7-C RNAse domain-containing protein n=1 Tax=Timema genevievae TaxID=629358 RepID=A0A7R9K6L8_TIMGE|nr:unnamed protein product [Timema genevievae]